MSDQKMRKSSVAILSALGVLALIVVVLVGLGRTVVTRISGNTQAMKSVDFSNKVTTKFNVKDFQKITFIGSWKVDLKQGKDWQVELNYPKDIERDIKVTTRDNELILNPGDRDLHSINWGFWGGGQNRSLRARIVMPNLQALNITGASDMHLIGFSGDNLNVTISGAGNIEGNAGHYNNLNLTLSGAGKVNLRDMKFANARLILSGAGSVDLGMDGGVLSGNLSGFGHVTYYGTISDNRLNISGFGKVTHGN